MINLVQMQYVSSFWKSLHSTFLSQPSLEPVSTSAFCFLQEQHPADDMPQCCALWKLAGNSPQSQSPPCLTPLPILSIFPHFWGLEMGVSHRSPSIKSFHRWEVAPLSQDSLFPRNPRGKLKLVQKNHLLPPAFLSLCFHTKTAGLKIHKTPYCGAILYSKRVRLEFTLKQGPPEMRMFLFFPFKTFWTWNLAAVPSHKPFWILGIHEVP